MLILTRLVTNPSRRRSLHLSVSHTTELSHTSVIGHTHSESTQAKVLPTLPGLDVFPDTSSQPYGWLKTHWVWCTSADGHIHLRRIPSKVNSHPYRTSLQSKVIPTPFQVQFTAQDDPHTLPGPVYLSEHILLPLWQDQDYCFTTIYTTTPLKLYVQLHEWSCRAHSTASSHSIYFYIRKWKLLGALAPVSLMPKYNLPH